MASRNLWRIGLIALTGIVTFVATADTSQAFWRRRAGNYNNGSGCGNGCGCSSCGCAAATSAPACGCTTATGTYDQASNNGHMGQGQYTQGQQGFRQGAPIQQGTPYEARRETFRSGE